MLALIEWLAQTPGSIALVESLYVYGIVESFHVVALGLFLGTLAVVDFRLLGWMFRQTPVSEITARFLPWTAAGFVIMVVTGLLLFYAIPIRTYQSIWFRTKVLLLVVAGINAWLLHRRMARDRPTWDKDPAPPLGVKIAAMLSIGTWIGVIIMGRMIAYNWFDCDRQPQSDFINWAAGCVVALSDAP